MQTRPLGTSGLTVSVVGLGCNNFGGRTDLAATRRVVDQAIDSGITLFDTADAYGDPAPKGTSEEFLGESLGPRRKNVVVATKFGLDLDDGNTLPRSSRAYIMKAVEASLRRLRTDWIDFYQLHRPDGVTPFDETLRALDDLVKQGKVRAIGSSNMTPAQVDETAAIARDQKLTPFSAGQEQYSLLVRGIERDVLPALTEQRQSLLPYFPLASGILTGKYKRGAPPPEGSRLAYSSRHIHRFGNDAYLAAAEKLEAFAASRGHTLLELAFGWLLGNPAVASVIAGATKPEQIAANAAAANWTLTPEEYAEASRITADLPAPKAPA